MLFKFYLILDHSYYSWAYRANTNSLWKDQTFFSTRPDWFCIHILYFILLRCLCFIPPSSELPNSILFDFSFSRRKKCSTCVHYDVRMSTLNRRLAISQTWLCKALRLLRWRFSTKMFTNVLHWHCKIGFFRWWYMR